MRNHSVTAIGHGDHQPPAVTIGSQFHNAMGGSMTQCVVEQVAHDAQRVDEIEPADKGRRVEIEMHIYTPPVEHALGLAQRSTHEIVRRIELGR